MKSTKLFSILLLGSVLFGSCAIHNEFPFICFERPCVRKQFHGINVQIKSKSFAMKQKRNSNKKKKLREGGKVSLEDKKEAPEISYSRSHFYTKIKFLFYLFSDSTNRTYKDSILLSLRDGRSFIEYDEQRGNGFIHSLGINNITAVEIYMYDTDSTVAYRNTHKWRIKKIRKYLIANGIPFYKIHVVSKKN